MPHPRVPVVAKTPAPVIITPVGNILSSNYASGNQWYFNDTLIAGSNRSDRYAAAPGNYKDIVSDSVGCVLVSNEYIYTPGNDIGLAVTPNPNQRGIHDPILSHDRWPMPIIRMLDINGKLLYESNNPNFQGSFSKTMSLGAVSAGMYVLQLEIGGKKYVQKIMVY